MNYDITIGLEVHVQLQLNTKIFSGSSTQFGAPPNTQASIIDLGLPGVLPVLNQDAVKMAVMFGLAINAEIPAVSIFERKNYFYPDLPKGYQISQYRKPIVGPGVLPITLEDGSTKIINIVRAHLEEDAGKSLHEDFNGMTGIDLNRSGIALLEIVSAPDLSNTFEAIAYLKNLHALVCYLGICDGNMQEGSFRVDANVSIKPLGALDLGTRTELKNINSFRFVEKAINYEVSRQSKLLDAGEKVIQETRLFDADNNTTRSMRSKEEANDYRYFPDPDLLPVIIEPELISAIKEQLPELPREKMTRLQREHQLSIYDANLIVSDKNIANYFEAAVKVVPQHGKLVANWLIGEFFAFMNKYNTEFKEIKIFPEALGTLVLRIVDNTISSKIAKDIFSILWEKGGDVDNIIQEQGLKQLTDTTQIEQAIREVIAVNEDSVQDYRSGKTKAFGFLIGQVMKKINKANPQLVNELLKKYLA